MPPNKKPRSAKRPRGTACRRPLNLSEVDAYRMWHWIATGRHGGRYASLSGRRCTGFRKFMTAQRDRTGFLVSG